MHRTCMRPLVFTAFLSDSFSLLDSPSVLLPRISFGAPISRVARARDFTTFQNVRSLFPALPNASYFPGVAPFVVSFDYRHETRRLFLETPVRIFLFLSPSKTYVAFESQQHLSQIIASGIFLDLTMVARFI